MSVRRNAFDATADALWGAVDYRLLVSHDPPTIDYAHQLVDQLRRAVLK